ncbi:MAG: M3 family peptidase, partial [Verrucomicrobiales bacterium]|nr:M3 family peptidase [Verrucomicrobiales bacterium]
MSSHPFLDENFHIRWSQLVPENIEPDIRAGLEEARETIDALAAWDGEEELTYENTLLALENAGEALNRGWTALSHLDSVRNNDDQREAYNKMLPEVTEFSSSIHLNEGLWKRVKAYSETENAKALTGAKRRLLEESLTDFRESGADLSADKKERLEEVQSELAKLTQKFSENVLDSTNDWDLIIEDESRLAGLPPTAKGILLSEAKSKDLGTEEIPVWRVTLKFPVYFPVLEFADDESLRKEVWEGANTIGRTGKWDNTELIWKILKLRQEKAGLLGKSQFADQALSRRMAKNGETALNFVEDLHGKTAPFFQKEVEELQQFKAAATGGDPEPLEPWDVAYWSEKQRKAKYDFDQEETRPYFPINRVLEGMFELTSKVFGFRVEEKKAVFIEPGADAPDPGPDEFEVWHPEVKYYQLYDEESGDHLGSFYADWHPRDEKRGGAWMNYLRTGLPARSDQSRTPHLGLICGNMTPSTAE